MVGRNQRMPNWRGSTPAPPIRRATRSACPPMSRARSSSVASWTAWLIGSTSRQRPDGLRPPNTMNAPLVMRTIAGVGKVASRSAVTFVDQARPQSDELGGADEIAFIGLAGAKRQFARKLHRVGADAVIGRDPAQSAQAPVERRPLAERRRGLHHRRSSLSRPGLARRTTIRTRPRCSPAPRAATVTNDHPSAAS